ncbi:Copia protein, partial [Durusdinium trenchii]
MAEMVWGEQGEWRLVKLPEANVWAIEKKVKGTGVVHGHVAVYVDDVMVSGTDATLAAFIEKFRSMWTCSEADWVEEGKVTKFCGLDGEKDGGGFRIHQESYIRLMMAKHEIEGISKLPKVEVPTEDEEEPELACIRHAQALTGEVLWVEVLKYLAGTPTLGLYYGTVEEIS